MDLGDIINELMRSRNSSVVELDRDPDKFEYSEEIIDNKLLNQVLRIDMIHKDVCELKDKLDLLHKEIEFRIAETRPILDSKYQDVKIKYRNAGFIVTKKGKAYVVAWDKV